MPEFSLNVAATFSAQIVGAGMMALLLFAFHSQYRKSYLLHWTLAWTSLAVFHVATAASTMLANGGMRLAASVIAGVCGFLQIGWICFGVYELIRRRPVRIRESEYIIGGLAVAGVVTSLLGAGYARAVVSAIAYFAAAILLWRVRGIRHARLGSVALGGALLVYGVEQLRPIAVIDFMLQAMMAIGMIACLLEDEREASELATVEIEHLAYHDALTGLPNRPLFIDRLIVALAQAARANTKLAVFFCDLDRFKDINDSLGHTIGDSLLKGVADRIRRCVREGDTVARFGGDEFTLLIPKIDNIEDAAKIAAKIIETLKIPFFVAERELFVTMSIGISLFPSDGADPETLVRNADTAMYRAKEQGRDNYQLYAPAMNARALERLALENMLRKALNHDELVLYYQPLVDAQTRNVAGLEALIRWHHPELGLLSPAHFISVAELSGLIIPIGEWVIRTACRQMKIWQKKIDRDLKVSVNLSARQFQQPDLVDQVRRALHDTGLHPGCLELEITESNAMQNAENSIYTLRELKSIGVRIAMDDFGTGYSSLNYLKRFPIDTLKLDQTFVKDVTTDASDAAIASAVISMAHSLNLDVVAEGVETEEQFAFLKKQRCDRIQGYLFSPPMAPEAIESFLVERRALSAS